jgi:hypothetical protein
MNNKIVIQAVLYEMFSACIEVDSSSELVRLDLSAAVLSHMCHQGVTSQM